MNFWDWFWLITLTLTFGLPIVVALTEEARPVDKGKVFGLGLSIWFVCYGLFLISIKAGQPAPEDKTPVVSEPTPDESYRWRDDWEPIYGTLNPDSTAPSQDDEMQREQEAWEKDFEEWREQNKNKPQNTDSCLHREQGICWDDVDEAGYEDGMYDGMSGTYGQMYFDTLPERFGDCTGLCEDVYEDAYEEGYRDGQAELKRGR